MPIAAAISISIHIKRRRIACAHRRGGARQGSRLRHPKNEQPNHPRQKRLRLRVPKALDWNRYFTPEGLERAEQTRAHKLQRSPNGPLFPRRTGKPDSAACAQCLRLAGDPQRLLRTGGRGALPRVRVIEQDERPLDGAQQLDIAPELLVSREHKPSLSGPRREVGWALSAPKAVVQGTAAVGDLVTVQLSRYNRTFRGRIMDGRLVEVWL